jgi:hypothetical protein
MMRTATSTPLRVQLGKQNSYGHRKLKTRPSTTSLFQHIGIIYDHLNIEGFQTHLDGIRFVSQPRGFIWLSPAIVSVVAPSQHCWKWALGVVSPFNCCASPLWFCSLTVLSFNCLPFRLPFEMFLRTQEARVFWIRRQPVHHLLLPIAQTNQGISHAQSIANFPECCSSKGTPQSSQHRWMSTIPTS